MGKCRVFVRGCFVLELFVGFFCAIASVNAAAPSPYVVTIEAEKMDHIAMADGSGGEDPAWKVMPRPYASEGSWLVPDEHKDKTRISRRPASQSIAMPASGKYYLWVRYEVHPIRAKAFSIVIQGQNESFGTLPYGATGSECPRDIYGDQDADKNGLIWTRREMPLAAGKAELLLKTLAAGDLPLGIKGHPPSVDVIILTDDASFRPER